ncbi:MAG: hypothetical protein QM770_12530 [Tepidisphaeraceae bacterium]
MRNLTTFQRGSTPRTLRKVALASVLAVAGLTAPLRATDIANVQAAALDQPRINAYISLTPGGAPQVADIYGDTSFNITAYYDTGASGVLLSEGTADALGIPRSTYNGNPVIFSDVGVAGSDNFNVSTPVSISLAKYHPDADVDNQSTYTSVYNQSFNNIRTQIGPVGVEVDPALGDLDVFGMPTMTGKVVVMDPKPVNTLLDTMRTYVYNPGTAYNAGASTSNPGIPTVDRHIKLSYVSFDKYTQTTPTGASPPSLRTNPFIGPNPFVAGDTTPQVRLAYGGASTEGSFLLDTGAAASIISKSKASALGVTYDPNTINSDSPVLLYNGQPIEDQFQLTIGGIGGSKVVAGFYLSSLLMRTEEGVATNLNDPNHLRFTDAPVLVSDISVANPNNPSDTYTLDGIIGMNFWVASAGIAGVDASGFPLITSLSRGNFDWVTFDEPAGKLGLKLAVAAPQDELEWLGDILGGSPPNHWDFEAANWSGPNLIDPYTDGSKVTFGNVTLYPTVILNEVVAPGAVTFNNESVDNDGTNYTLTGTGKITGYTGVTKTGGGIVYMNTANDYSGATVVQAGEIVFVRSRKSGRWRFRRARV